MTRDGYCSHSVILMVLVKRTKLNKINEYYNKIKKKDYIKKIRKKA